MRRYALLGTLISTLALCVAACGSHPGGDPGSGILSALTSVRAAVPPGSTHVSSTTKATSWIGSCNDEYFKKGWSEIGVTVGFTSSDADAKMHADVSRWMLAHGWRVSKPDTTGPTWTRRLSQGVAATARLSYGGDFPPVIPPTINATAPPEAPVGECAGG